MPEVASHYIENRDIEAAQKIQNHILRAYELDFVKHVGGSTSIRIHYVWNALPSQLAKENKKFRYKAIRSGARAREYKAAIQWLIQAGLVYKVSRVEKPGVPLKAYEDVSAFKLFLFESGILMRLSELEPSIFIDGHQFFTEFKGALAENYVAQAIKKIYGKPPYYWTSNGKAEIDFLINHKGYSIPVEVKSGTATKAKSLAVFKKLYNPVLRVRVSIQNLKMTDMISSISQFFIRTISID